MGCTSDYMQSTTRELSLSRVHCLLDELAGKGKPKEVSSGWNGYHPKVYGRYTSTEDADVAVASLCQQLQKVDVTRYSLEMQLWWRDHEQADAARVKQETLAAEQQEAKAVALRKLTPAERLLLGVCGRIPGMLLTTTARILACALPAHTQAAYMNLGLHYQRLKRISSRWQKVWTWLRTVSMLCPWVWLTICTRSPPPTWLSVSGNDHG